MYVWMNVNDVWMVIEGMDEWMRMDVRVMMYG